MTRRTVTFLAVLVLVVAGVVSVGTGPAHATAAVFINEIHYDNIGGDQGEAIEVAGPAGTDLAGWSIVLYNGSNSKTYRTISLSGTIPNQDDGFGTLSFARSGIQNGNPDGLALVDTKGTADNNDDVVVEFLSYGGTFTAAEGPAMGTTSVNIGVSESNSTPDGHSLQRTGSGRISTDFTWAAAQANTFGSVNTGQDFTATVAAPAKPTGLMAAAGNEQVTLSWDDPSDSTITGYEYQQKSGTDMFGTTWTTITDSAPGGANATSYTVPSLVNGTAYTFRIRAVNSAGESDPSDTVEGTPQVTAPEKPTGLAAALGNEQVTLSWDDPSDSTITGYEYQQKSGTDMFYHST